jgi:hypothetical protein
MIELTEEEKDSIETFLIIYFGTIVLMMLALIFVID